MVYGPSLKLLPCSWLLIEDARDSFDVCHQYRITYTSILFVIILNRAAIVLFSLRLLALARSLVLLLSFLLSDFLIAFVVAVDHIQIMDSRIMMLYGVRYQNGLYFPMNGKNVLVIFNRFFVPSFTFD